MRVRQRHRPPGSLALALEAAVAVCCIAALARALRMASATEQLREVMCFAGAVAFAIGLSSRVFARQRRLSTWFPVLFMVVGVLLTAAGVATKGVWGGARWPLEDARSFLLACLVCLSPWIERVYLWLTGEEPPKAGIARILLGRGLVPGQTRPSGCAVAPSAHREPLGVWLLRERPGPMSVGVQLAVLASCTFFAASMLFASGGSIPPRETMCSFGVMAFAIGLWFWPFARARRVALWFPVFFLIGGVLLTIAGLTTSAIWGGPLWPLDAESTYVGLFLILLSPWESEVLWWLTTDGVDSGAHRGADEDPKPDADDEFESSESAGN